MRSILLAALAASAAGLCTVPQLCPSGSELKPWHCAVRHVMENGKEVEVYDQSVGNCSHTCLSIEQHHQKEQIPCSEVESVMVHYSNTMGCCACTVPQLCFPGQELKPEHCAVRHVMENGKEVEVYDQAVGNCSATCLEIEQHHQKEQVACSEREGIMHHYSDTMGCCSGTRTNGELSDKVCSTLHNKEWEDKGCSIWHDDTASGTPELMRACLLVFDKYYDCFYDMAKHDPRWPEKAKGLMEFRKRLSGGCMMVKKAIAEKFRGAKCEQPGQYYGEKRTMEPKL